MALDRKYHKPNAVRKYEELRGAWCECEEHGLTENAIHVGAVPYCPADDCDARVRLVHSVMDDPKERTVWTRSPTSTIPATTKRPARVWPKPKDGMNSVGSHLATMDERVLFVLRDGLPKRAKQIADATGDKQASVAASMSKLLKAGKLVRRAEGLYGLAADHMPA